MNFKSAIIFSGICQDFSCPYDLMPYFPELFQLIFLHETEFDTFLTHISSRAKRGMKCGLIC